MAAISRGGKSVPVTTTRVPGGPVATLKLRCGAPGEAAGSSQTATADGAAPVKRIEQTASLA